MTYRIARNEQIYGPYTEAEVRQYLATGNILLSDLAQVEGTSDWVPLVEMFPFAAAAYSATPQGVVGGAAAAMPLFPDPPDFPWWAALLLGIFTGGIFFVIWDLVEASWLRRLERGSAALMLYIAVAVLYLFKLPSIWHTVDYNAFGGPLVHTHMPGLGMAGLILTITARFVFRRELLEHFNGPEPIGLRLNAFWTLLFGGLYFQYHFNRINELKRAMHVSVPA